MDLADLTTFRIGGPARDLVMAETEDDLVGAVRRADATGEPVLVVAGGSNMLVADAGFPGTVVVVRTTGRSATQDGDTVTLTVAAGEVWDDLVAWTVGQGWGGLELLSGIPGRAGAAPVQNIGAYGRELAQSAVAVRVYDRTTDRVSALGLIGCDFGYRTSLFKRDPDRYIVLDVTFRLVSDGLSAPVTYVELVRHLGVPTGTRVPVADARTAVLALRRSKGMVLDATDHDTWSAGSFFTNPVLTATQAARLPEAAPRYPQPDGTVKTSAAWLIEHAGFPKGYGTGPARLSTKHVLALTNRGGATAAEVLELARTIRDGVRTMYGITLEPEPLLVGLSL